MLAAGRHPPMPSACGLLVQKILQGRIHRVKAGSDNNSSVTWQRHQPGQVPERRADPERADAGAYCGQFLSIAHQGTGPVQQVAVIGEVEGRPASKAQLADSSISQHRDRIVAGPCRSRITNPPRLLTW